MHEYERCQVCRYSATKAHHERERVLVLPNLRHDDGGRAAQHLAARADHEGPVHAEPRDAVVVVQRLLLDGRPAESVGQGEDSVRVRVRCRKTNVSIRWG